MGRVRPPPHRLPPSSQSVSFPTAEILQKSKLQTDKKLRGEAGELSEPLSSSTEVFEVDSKNKKVNQKQLTFLTKTKKISCSTRTCILKMKRLIIRLQVRELQFCNISFRKHSPLSRAPAGAACWLKQEVGRSGASVQTGAF